LLQGLSTVVDCRYDLEQAFLADTVGWGPLPRGNFMMSQGLGSIVSGRLGKPLLQRLSMRRFTLLANMASASSMLLFGVARKGATAMLSMGGVGFLLMWGVQAVAFQ
jgi:hypothetical protein